MKRIDGNGRAQSRDGRRAAAPGHLITALTLLFLVAACGGAQEEAAIDSGADAGAIGRTPQPPGKFDRARFVLCDALEPHSAELAAIVGFERDPDRAFSVSRSECVVRGRGGDFARVTLQPAIAPSAEAVATMSYDGDASPAPEIGKDAWYVADFQPHVIFPMGGLILDVDASTATPPTRATMIELTLKVRDLLRAAND